MPPRKKKAPSPDFKTCPIVPELFRPLTEAAEFADYLDEIPIQVIRETVELVIEQLSAVVGEKLLGIKRRTRKRMETLRIQGGFDESFSDVLSATIDIAKEVDDQGYVALEGFNEEFVIPWLYTLQYWLIEESFDCSCVTAVDDFLDRFA